MIKKIGGEQWKQLQFRGSKSLNKKYAMSSLGRAASYYNDIFEDGKILNGSITTGYRTLNLHADGANYTMYFHREIARLFLTRPSQREKYVIHLNYNKTDNSIKNLQWASQFDLGRHHKTSPVVGDNKKTRKVRSVGLKLSIPQVKALKTAIESPVRKLTYKQLAEKYNISLMTIYRIKSGESWGAL